MYCVYIHICKYVYVYVYRIYVYRVYTNMYYTKLFVHMYMYIYIHTSIRTCIHVDR